MVNKEASSISFLIGIDLVLIIIIVIISSLPGRDNLYHAGEIFALLPIYRCLLLMIMVVLSAGVCIEVFRYYKVNYIFIFEIDPQNKLN
mmetsp:Transcript_29983/g.29215  ORF Transcript_29983/g.29215 Transcript_29983/m.29215 type:complete len:89 (-) Transcript_29983:1009-1275(-)